MYWGMSPVIWIFLILLRVGMSQDDFSGQIKCYTCEGRAENSTCSDPIDVTSVGVKVCDRGICLKWTKYKKGILYMIRTCSTQLDFHLTMIDGVCRTERNGNGFLCMCGKNLCNSVSRQHGDFGQRTIVLMLSLLLCCELILQRLWST